MALSFQNQTSQTVWICVAYYDPSTGASNQYFRKEGWWSIAPGGTFLFWNVDLRTVNRYFYYEGELAADATVWGGTGNAWTEITDAAFNQGFLDQTNCVRWVDFQQLDFGGLVGLTVVLGPKPGQVTLSPVYPHSDHSDHGDGGWGGSSS